MKKTTVRDLRYHFPEMEAWLNKGEEIVVHKRQKMIARLLPIRPKGAAYPDFSALRRQIFGKKTHVMSFGGRTSAAWICDDGDTQEEIS